MEQGYCLMSMKRTFPRSEYFVSPAFHPFPAGLREERAAEWIWPPRSYSCSFCTREFRSAQALGGHMNVHRRDRARLKQQCPNAEQRESTNQNPDHSLEANPSVGLASRFSAFSSAAGKENNGDTKDGASKNLGEGPRKSEGAKRDKNVMEDSVEQEHGCQVRTELSMGLNSESCQNATSGSSCKRAKTDVSRLPLMLELVLGVLDPASSKIKNQHEELDLELRLGADPPNR